MIHILQLHLQGLNPLSYNVCSVSAKKRVKSVTIITEQITVKSINRFLVLCVYLGKYFIAPTFMNGYLVVVWKGKILTYLRAESRDWPSDAESL